MERVSDKKIEELIHCWDGEEDSLIGELTLDCLRELQELRAQSRWVKVSPDTMPPAPDFPYWCVVEPKSAEEAYRDTSGNPIMGRFAPYTDVVRTYKRTDGTIGFICNGLSKVTMYFTLPAAPKEGENGQ